MKRKITAVIVAIVIIFTQTGLVYAKSFSSGRSFGGSSISRSSKSFSSYKSSSSSWSGSSSSKSSGGWSGSSSSSKSSSSSSDLGSSSSKSYGGWLGSSSSSGKSSGSGGSSSEGSRGVPNSYSAAGSAFNSSSSKTSTAKGTSMQSAYNKQASASNYKTYNQKLNAEQQKVYNSSMNRNYNVGSKMNYDDALNTRTQRISSYDTSPVRMHVNNYYFGGPLSYGSAFVGIWDLWFLMRASDLFWYHHWNDIYPYRSYFDSADFAARQAAVAQVQAQGTARNSEYLDPSVAPDLQFSKAYVDGHKNSVYNANSRHSHPILTLLIILIFVAILIFVMKRLLKKPVKPRYSSIY